MGGSCSVVSTSAPQASGTYFHTIPPEVAQNVLRFVSRTPRAVGWESGVRLRDAVNVLKAGGILADVARERFVAVNTSSKSYGFSDDDDVDDRVHGIYVSNVRAFRRFLVRGRPRLQTAYISVHFNLRAWSRAQAAAIGANCTGLKKLRLSCYTAWADIGVLWEGVGDTLEELAMAVMDSIEPGEWAAALNLIRMFCPAIRALDFEMVVEWQSFAQFCISYGDQLQTLKLGECYTEPSCYADIVAGCNNVRVDTKIATELLVPSIRALGRHLEALHIIGDEMDAFVFDIPQLREAAECCTQLEVVALHPDEIGSRGIVEILGALLEDRKPRLQRIEIHERTAEIYGAPILPNTPTTHEILGAIAERTAGELRHLVFACDAPAPGTFDEIARINKHLETVHILLFERHREEDEDEEEPPETKDLEAALEGVVKSFSRNCPDLRTLLFVDCMGCFPSDKKLKSVEEHCRKLKHRALYIKMLDHTYLQ